MNPPFGRKKIGSIGPPVYGVHVAVVDENGADLPAGTVGDIRVSGSGVMDSYWNDTSMTRKTLQNGWVRTGDLGRYDEDGYLKVANLCGTLSVSWCEWSRTSSFSLMA